MAHGYLHRDIKPANSLIKNGIHKVADFGLTCEADMNCKLKIKGYIGKGLIFFYFS